MIPGANIISQKASVASINGAGGGAGEHCEPLSRKGRGRSPLREFSGPKKHLNWLKIDLNVA